MSHKFTITLFIFSILLVACSHYDSLQKNGKESTASEKSHNSGKDCMSCHNNSSNEASSNAWWNVAGTVYSGSSPMSNITMELWTGPNGTGNKITSLVSDKNGNFYTEKILNFNDGCYPLIKSGNTVKYMSAKFLGGMSCTNSGCHGGTQDIIDIN